MVKTYANKEEYYEDLINNLLKKIEEHQTKIDELTQQISSRRLLDDYDNWNAI